jgi:hypothetical protein
VTVTAPPRPPRPSDPVERDDPEALIEEARQRTRRRRRRYAATAVLLAIIGVSLIIVLARPGPSENAAAGLPAPAGATDQDDAATVIAHDVQMHWAWVLAYADGRVVWQFDGLAIYRGYTAGPSALFERRLTPDGVDLVRSGAIPPHTLLGQLSPAWCAEGDERCPIPHNPSALPAGTWADSEIRTYEPSRWAIGALSESEIARFPAAAQALLRGAGRTTYNNVFLLYPEDPDRHRPIESLELTTAEVSALRAALIDAGIPEVSAARAMGIDGRTPFVSPDWISLGNQLNLFFSPILPHGEPIAFLG